jgi:predicted DsbA family dithiol-disulfide isomerase
VATLEVFADVRCPFTHVGLRRLVERRMARGGGFTLRVRAWPLELVNGAPMDVDLVDEEVRALREQVAPDLFAGFSPATFGATSLPALALTARAYERDLSTGEAVALALRWAMFEEGRDIADPDLLGGVARTAGVAWSEGDAAAQVLDEFCDGGTRGVVGSPQFFVGGEGWFCPGMEISHDERGFRIAPNDGALDTLVERASLS